jgi:hypothetical protein
LRFRDRGPHRARKRQPVTSLPLQQLRQQALVDGNFASLEGSDFLNVSVDRNYVVSNFCQAGGGNQSHIS